MDRCLLSLIMGAILSLFSPIVPVLFYKTLLVTTLLLCFLLKKWRIVLCFMLGALWTLNHGHVLKSPFDNYQHTLFSNKPVLVTLKVDSIIDYPFSDINEELVIQDKVEKEFLKPLRFYAKLLSVEHRILKTPIFIRLSWSSPTFHIKQNNLLKLNIKVKPAHSLANVASFDYQAWLISRNVVASGYVKASENNQLLNTGYSVRQQWFDRYLEHFDENLSEENAALIPLIQALIFGERSQFTDVHWQVLKETGTQHLIAISGLHIGLVMALAYGLLSLLVRLVPFHYFSEKSQIYLTHINFQPLLLLLSYGVALGYGHLANLSIPTLRALTMIALVIIFKLSTVSLSTTRTLLLCVVGVLIVQPLSMLSASFWLSFYALGVIFITMWRFNAALAIENKWQRYFVSLVVLQLMLTLLMLPITTFLFGEISSISLLANVFAVPVVSLVLMPILLGSVLFMAIYQPIAIFLADVGIILLKPLWQFLTFLEQYNQVNDLASSQDFLIICLLFLMCCYYLFSTNQRIAFKVTLFFTLAFAIGPFVIVKGEASYWRMSVLDVGQGLAVVVTRNERAIIYDTGAFFPSGFNMADSVIIPYLRSQNIKQIDKLFISHDDNDHAGSLLMLSKHYPVKELIINLPSQKVSKAFQNSQITPCLRDMNWQWQQLIIIALHPSKERGDDNDDSCVISISDHQHKVLLTGDISRKIEHQLINTTDMKADGLSYDVLVAPHHGSKTSSSKRFIQWVKPSYAVFSTGFMNRWGMPNQEVLARYQQANITTVNTAESGMVEFTFKRSAFEMHTFRADIKPYWFAN